MNANEFLAQMEPGQPLGDQTRQELYDSLDREVNGDDKYYDEISDLVEQHPIRRPQRSRGIRESAD